MINKSIIAVICILITFYSFSQNKVLIRKHLGYAENYGNSENETGGKHLEVGKWIFDSTSVVFSVVSGKLDGVNIVAKNKYDVWASVINNGVADHIYWYDKTFRRFDKDTSFISYMITVNGSHNRYRKQACKVKVDLIKHVDLDSSIVYTTKYETDGRREFQTVAADGVSYLDLFLNYPGNKYVTVSYPEIGKIRGENIFTSNMQAYRTVNVSLDETGYGKFRYYPPKYISQKQWDKFAKIEHEKNGNIITLVDLLSDKLMISYSNYKNQKITDTVIVKVCRTPIFFIHGFLGDSGTWSYMRSKIAEKGYIGLNHNYNAGDGSIEDQSRLLGEYINDYFNNCNIKVKKVNLVAHSMGGLIARHYVQSRLYDNNVRKLITVGTPHHGVGNDDNFHDWVGYWVGKKGAEWFDKHKIAVHQLKENSSFLKRLNSGEEGGRHLVKGVQFGNIYNVPWDYVVRSNSAYLNMAATKTVYDYTHSTSIPWGTSITISPEVEDQILSWLESDIKPSRNLMVHAELSRASKGEVFRVFFRGDEYVEEQIPSFPHKINIWDGIITKEGKAIIHLKAGSRIWGSIFLEEYSEIYIQSCSPHQMEIRMFGGKALFKSRKEDGSHFIVSLHNRNFGTYKDGVHVFSPLAYVRGLDTEFAIENLDEIRVLGIEGRMEISTDITPNYKPVLISEQQAVIVNGKKINETEYSKPDWYIDLDQIIKDDDGPEDLEEEQLSDVKKTEISSSESSEKSDMILGFIILGIGFIIVIIVIVLLIITVKKVIPKV